jgi:hypothetical protein
VRSGRTGGSISQTISNGRALMMATLGHELACRCQLPATDHTAPFTGSGWELAKVLAAVSSGQ